MSSRANIYIDQGTDFQITLELFDGDDDELFIENFNFYSGIKKMYSTSTLATFEHTLSNNDLILELSANTTVNLEPGKYEYDVLMKKQSGEISKVVEGLAFVVSTISEVS